MFCSACGWKLDPVAKFCSRCGNPVTSAGESADNGEGATPAPYVPSMIRTSRSTAEMHTPLTGPPAPPVPHTESEPLPYATDLPAERRRLPQPVLIGGVGLLAVGLIVLLWMMHAMGSGADDSKVDVTIYPVTARVVAGNALDFAASVRGAKNPEIVWTVQEGESGGRVVNRGAQASGGTVSLLVVYIAPGGAGTYHLVATSKAYPKKSASAEIKVTAR